MIAQLVSFHFFISMILIVFSKHILNYKILLHFFEKRWKESTRTPLWGSCWLSKQQRWANELCTTYSPRYRDLHVLNITRKLTNISRRFHVFQDGKRHISSLVRNSELSAACHNLVWNNEVPRNMKPSDISSQFSGYKTHRGLSIYLYYMFF